MYLKIIVFQLYVEHDKQKNEEKGENDVLQIIEGTSTPFKYLFLQMLCDHLPADRFPVSLFLVYY